MNSLRIILLKAITFVMAFNFIQAQSNFLGHQIRFTPKTRPERILEQDNYRSAITKKYTPLISNKKYLDEFVEEMVRYKIDYLNSNREYEDFTLATAYLNKLFKNLDFKMAFDRPIDVKLMRDPDFNAYVYEDGTVYINIGLLANVDNEAEIAAIMAHEVGHLVNQHVYKSFLHGKTYINNQNDISAIVPWYGQGIISSINKKVYSNRLVHQETEADQFAFVAVKESAFDYSAFKSVFSKFTSIENKYKNSVFYSRPWNYFKTHPNSDQRAESAVNNGLESKGKNRFIVDSTLFFKLKRLAIDESINLYFEQLEFSACLEMAFKQHLLFPADPFYLFYVTECTRRLIASDASYANTLFIAGVYNAGFCKDPKGLAPKVVMTGRTIKTEDSKVNFSIFNKLIGPLVGMTKNEYATISEHPLLQKDTIRFLTYEDAYLYFTRLNRKLHYNLNNYEDYSREDSPISAFDSIKGPIDKETYYTYLPGVADEYNRSDANEGTILWILYNFSYVSQTTGFGFSEISVNKNPGFDKLMAYYKNAGINLNRRLDLDFDEYDKVSHFFNIVSGKLTAYTKNGKITKRASVKYNFSKVMPELYSLLRAHNYKAVVFSSVHVTLLNKQGFGTSLIENWNVNNYWFDARSNTVECFGGNITSYKASSFLAGRNNEKDLEQLYFQSIFNTIAPGKP